MKITILSVPSSPPDYAVRLDSSANPDDLEISQHCDSGVIKHWSITREQFNSLARPQWPEPVAVPMVHAESGVDGHWWIANGVYKGLWQIVNQAPWAE